MKPLKSSSQSLPRRWLTSALLATTGVFAAIAVLSLTACSDDVLFPAEAELAQASVLANDGTVRRPFAFRHQWDASSLDNSDPCIAQIPNPAAPGTFIELPFGVLHASGTARHWGRHTVELTTSSCTWDADLGAIHIVGPWRAVVASGDTLWGTYEGDLYPMPDGSAEFFGSLDMEGGTGRFQSVSGEASLRAHDEPDRSGWDWGSGWIAY